MAIVMPQAGPLAEELAKWEQHRTQYVPHGMNPGNPYVFRPYPVALYRAHKNAMGKVMCIEAEPNSWDYVDPRNYERACLEVEAFNKRCYTTAADETEETKMINNGWRHTPAEAIAYLKSCDDAIAQAAAEANYAAQRMSKRAQQELEDANAETHEHVTDVVGSSKKTRGRKPKIKPVTEG